MQKAGRSDGVEAADEPLLVGPLPAMAQGEEPGLRAIGWGRPTAEQSAARGARFLKSVG